MPRRTLSQQTGSHGQRIAAAAFEKAGGWIVRNQEEDFGIDVELELSDPDPAAHFLKCQIKSSKARRSTKGLRLKNEFLKYVYECRIPILLVQVETVSNNVWICWLQGCIEINRLQRSVYGTASSSLIAAEWLFPLDTAANEELKLVARGIHPIARAMQIRDLIQFGLETHDHELLIAANDLILKYHKEISRFPADILVDEILSLGNRIWATLEGNALSRLLYMLARSFGDTFTLEQIQKIVVRGDTYSRTGINALGILYDQFPEHMRGLQLGEIFRYHEDWRIAYFCNLRERYPGVSVVQLMSGKYDCALDRYNLLPSGSESLNKWANRGDCAILDYAYETLDASSKCSPD